MTEGLAMSLGSDKASVEDDLTLLDIAVALAESWKLLILVPLLIGLLVGVTLAFQRPPEAYVASGTLWISDEGIRSIRSGRFLTQAASRLSASGGQVTWQNLSGAISIVDAMPEVNQHILSVKWSSPARATEVFATVVDLLRSSAFADPSLQAFRAQLEDYLTIEAQLEEAVATLGQAIAAARPEGPSDIEMLIASSVMVDVAEQMRTNQAAIGALRSKIANWPDNSLQSTVDVSMTGRTLTWAIAAVLSTFASGFVIVFFILIRAGVRRAAQDEAGQRKIERLSAALRLWNRRV